MANETADLVIIGAGLYGIQAAKTYIQLHPERKLILLDAGKSIGGTWSAERIYPGLKTNNIRAWIAYPDLPLTPEKFDVQPEGHVRGEVVNEYLVAYARRFKVTEHLRSLTKVISVEHAEKDGWLVNWREDAGPSGTIHASKLILATGHTSEPLIPSFPGQHTFTKPIFHSRDFAMHSDLLKTAERIVVFGSAKSAWDAAYMFADAGIKTHMIIRASGRGPAWMVKYYQTPLQLSIESLAVRRIISWFSPCIWSHHGGYGPVKWFLHRTWLGQKITSLFWNTVSSDALQTSGLMGHPESEKLKPWSHMFWSGTSCSILNHDKDFFQFVRDGLIQVHIADVEKLAGDSVVLSTGETLHVDGIACATSWKTRPAFEFLPPGSDADLGLPHYSPDPDPDGRLARADQQILEAFPRLRDQPILNQHLRKLPTAEEEPFDPTKYNVPYLLYKFMVPPAYIHERSIAFLGIPLSFNQPHLSTAEALWTCAYMDGKVAVPATVDEAKDEAALHVRMGRWRNPTGYGASFPDWIFETLPWLEMIFGELGVMSWRRKGLSNIFLPYPPADFRGVVEEYQAKHGG
ncbi:hypothetical protein F4778DRAFT_675358 [Xylariomycetidae sp. FL2044]|nr:hypothetical protein F4778DRAFT_675358 [Xylariomycetidae sp. FL2044]